MRALRRAGLYLAALGIFMFSFGPLVLSFIGSIVPDTAMFAFPPDWFQEGVTLDNYRYIFFGEIPQKYETTGANMAMISDAARQVPRSMMNSFIVAFAVMVVNMVIGAPAAYAFARMRFRGKTASFTIIIMSRLLPAVALALPFYLLVQELGLLGSKFAMILVHSILTLPFTVLILSVFFRRVPIELEEAALVDGLTRFQMFHKIVLRVSGSSIFATGLFAFMLSYAEYLYAQVLSGEASNRQLSVVLSSLVRDHDVSWGLISTATFLTIVPAVILVALIWRLVVERVVEGAVQG